VRIKRGTVETITIMTISAAISEAAGRPDFAAVTLLGGGVYILLTVWAQRLSLPGGLK